MAKKKTAPRVPGSGNVFEYYVPNPTHGAKIKPTPMPTALISGGKSKYPKPGKFIEDNFILTAIANFGVKGSLNGENHAIQKLQVVRAALECGYGRLSNLTSALALKPHEATALTKYLLLRLQMVASCIEVDANQARLPKSFFASVEASDKAALSFIRGGIGAYLAARMWLVAGGDSIGTFLHAGIYMKGVNGATPMVTFPSTSAKAPDYLVVSGKGAWHVFESKGGTAVNRWTRIVEGLVQLSNLPNVAWTGAPAKPATTCVCVHTSVDSRRALRVTAVAPPGDGATGDGKQSVILIEGVCKLLQLLETLGQYHALADNVISRENMGDPEWKFATSSQFGGLIVGIPKLYLRRERSVRRRLAIFLALSEVLADPAFAEAKGEKTKLLVERVGSKLGHIALREKPRKIPSDALKGILNRIAGHLGEDDFLFRCSEHLGLGRLAQQLRLSGSQEVVFQLLRIAPNVVTSGGMYLEQLAPGSPESYTNGEPSVP